MVLTYGECRRSWRGWGRCSSQKRSCICWGESPSTGPSSVRWAAPRRWSAAPPSPPSGTVRWRRCTCSTGAELTPSYTPLVYESHWTAIESVNMRQTSQSPVHQVGSQTEQFVSFITFADLILGTFLLQIVSVKCFGCNVQFGLFPMCCSVVQGCSWTWISQGNVPQGLWQFLSDR